MPASAPVPTPAALDTERARLLERLNLPEGGGAEPPAAPPPMSLSAPLPPSSLDDLPPDGGRINRFINRLLEKLKVEEVPHIKRIIVTVVGGTILVLGVVMVVTPGPAIIVVPAGLAILGTEYAWARRWLRKAKQMPDIALTRTQRIKRAIKVVWGRWRHHQTVGRQIDAAAAERDLVPVPGSVYEASGLEEKQN